MAPEAPSSKPCIFCGIVAGRSPAFKVYEDDRTVAFLDLFPITRGHVLVVPKTHIDRLTDLPSSDYAGFLGVLADICRRVERLSAHYNVGLNQGALAGQIVFHMHFHVIPRYGDDSPLWAKPRNRLQDGDAQQIVDTLSAP
ncbi:MAG: HIT family protein [Thermoplasmata archaeon]